MKKYKGTLICLWFELELDKESAVRISGLEVFTSNVHLVLH